MIRYLRGNLLETTAEAVVNTVNEVGVMGKGIALMMREAFPAASKAYMAACKAGEVRVGKVLLTANEQLAGPRWIIHFPTKKHWRQPSRMEWVRSGLADLARVVREKGIRSVAVPPLGCGHGGLEWTQVRREIELALGALEGVDVIVYEPTSEYLNAPKREGLENLTPARALVVEMVRRYGLLGLECSNLEVQKLAWFLHRSIARLRLPDPLRLSFKANKYGPYADELRHLLNGLDGSYLHCERRLSEAGPMEPIWVERSRVPDVLAYLEGEAGEEYQPALEQAAAVIEGFQSPLGMELLASVDWLLSEEGCEPTVEGIKVGLQHWSGGRTAARRKLSIFDDRLLGLALDRLATVE